MATGSVTVVITCEIRPESLEMARQELAAIIEVVLLNEPACHGIRVLEGSSNPRRLLIIEQWESEEIFSGPHMEMPHMQTFLKRAETFLEGAAEFTFWQEAK